VPPERQSSTVEAAYRFLPARFEFLEEARLGGTAEPRSVLALEESAPPLGVLVNDLLIFNAHFKGVLVVDWRLETLCHSCLARSEGPKESVGEATPEKDEIVIRAVDVTRSAPGTQNADLCVVPL
jgi:hypothetical protein